MLTKTWYLIWPKNYKKNKYSQVSNTVKNELIHFWASYKTAPLVSDLSVSNETLITLNYRILSPLSILLLEVTFSLEYMVQTSDTKTFIA